MNLQDLKQEILEDGIIDADEVKQLEKILYADGIIDQEEANFLFELNDAVSGNENHSSWESFFIKAISDFLLLDELSPNLIDDDEAAWLHEKIKGDGQIDEIERNLLINLKARSKNFPDILVQLL